MPASDKERPPLAFCASCNNVYETPKELAPHLIGTAFECPTGQMHFAAIVAGETGKTWLRLRLKLFNYEHKYSPFVVLRAALPELFPDAGYYTVLRFFAFILILWLATFPSSALRIFTSFVSSCLIADIMLTHAAIAFASRWPADPFRSVVFSFFGFIQLALGFAVLYAAVEPSFARPETNPIRLGITDAFFVSFLIITTVGWADMLPVSAQHPTEIPRKLDELNKPKS